MKGFIASALATIIAFFGTMWGDIVDVFNNYEFTVDSRVTGKVLANPVSNVNIWSISCVGI